MRIGADLTAVKPRASACIRANDFDSCPTREDRECGEPNLVRSKLLGFEPTTKLYRKGRRGRKEFRVFSAPFAVKIFLVLAGSG